MPSPDKALIRCSIVAILAWPLSRVVAIRVSLTLSGSALIATGGFKSILRKTIPVSTGAGRKANLTLRPECKPIPTVSKAFLIVLCLVTEFGSGASFVFLIKAAGVEEQDAPRKFVRVKKSIEIHAGDKWASLEPFNGYKLSFAIDFGHPAIDATAQFVEVDFDNHTYINDVAKARTFGFVNDLEMLRSYGLAQGGTLDNAVVMDDYHVLNPDGLRSNDEFAKHKLLDAMGDLYVLGHPLVAHYKAFKSGHDLNNKLLRKLLSEPDSWEFVTFEDSSKAPSAFTNALVIPSI